MLDDLLIEFGIARALIRIQMLERGMIVEKFSIGTGFDQEN